MAAAHDEPDFKPEAVAPEYSTAQPAAHEPRSATDAVKNLTSPGVARIEAISECITLFDRVIIFFGVFLIAYVYGLDGTLRFSFQTEATSSFGQHSLQATINVLRQVIAAAAQPTAAKIADVFGRVELICLSVFFYVLGTVIEASANDVPTFSGGGVLYQIGYTMIILLVEVIIADITSTRSRLFFSYIPALPFIINTWVSGNISDAILQGGPGWKWGIGMWSIIYPVCALPLILGLWNVSRRAKKEGRLTNYRSSFQSMGFRNFSFELFWLLDVVGIILIIAVFALILTPLTIAGGFQSKWKEAHILAPLVVGILCIPVFIFWELRAPHPLVPFVFLKDRSVWAAFGIALCLNFAYAMQSDYLYTVLIVAFDYSYTGAVRIQSLYSFVSVIVGTLLGIVVFYVRRLKIFVVMGTCLYMVAFGLLIHYRGTPSSSGRAGMIGAQVLLGIAGGMFPYSTQAILQMRLRHENLAVVLGIFLATYNIGSALGYTVSGAMWTQILPGKLESSLAGVNSTLAVTAYADPINQVALVYPVGTPERTAVIEAYQSIQRLLTITGLSICVPLIGFALCLRNPHLNDEQTLAKEFESDSEGTDQEQGHAK